MDYNKTIQHIEDIVSGVESGELKSLKHYAMIANLEKICKKAKEVIWETANEDSLMYPNKTFIEDGITFEKRQGGIRYSYKGIVEIDNAEKALKELKDKYKSAFISREKNIMVANENGEEMESPTVSYSKDMLIVKKIDI